MFCLCKDWRRIATSLDRNAKNFMAGVVRATIIIGRIE